MTDFAGRLPSDLLEGCGSEGGSTKTIDPSESDAAESALDRLEGGVGGVTTLVADLTTGTAVFAVVMEGWGDDGSDSS